MSNKTDTAEQSFIKSIKEIFNGDRECLHQPDQSVEPGEVEIGILEDPVARALFSYWEEIRHNCTRLAQRAEKEADKSNPSVTPDQMIMARMRYDAISALFWEVVHSLFPKTQDYRVATGLRKGWKVVIYKNVGGGLFNILG
jgi:hypothetical protein